MKIYMNENLANWLIGLSGLSFIVLLSLPARAALTDLSDVPLVNDAGSSVKPNMMFILDNSGSMDFNYMPDNVEESRQCRAYYTISCGWFGCSTNTATTCGGLNSSTGSGGGDAPTIGGDPPSYSYQVNTIYYNPNVLYTPPVNPCNTAQNLPSMTDGTQVRERGHQLNPSCEQTSGTVNLVSNYPERIYCNSNDASGADFTNQSKCKRNGIHASNGYAGDYDYPDLTKGSGVNNSTPINWYNNIGTGNNSNPKAGTFIYPKTLNSNPHYYSITPVEYCTNSTLSSCDMRNSANGTYPVAAYVRYCQTSTYASDTNEVTGNNDGSPKCQAKYDGDHRYARYGNFARVDIISGNTFPKTTARTDCSGATCTYAEELINFSNWYAYYRTRAQTMKSSAGRAFSTIDNSFRVGYVTINPGNPVSSNHYLPIEEFNTSHKQDWFKKLYANDPSGSTPLREALSRVGRHYGAVTTGINDGMDDDPVEYECQQNFALLTTDGYWNDDVDDGRIDKLDGTAIGNQDNVDSGYSTRAVGAYDGGNHGTNKNPQYASNTLADVAMYYYKTDLRSSMDNKVPTSDKDTAEHQHMVTFTLGLGLDGELNYQSDYETATTGDFASIKADDLDWPIPSSGNPSTIDDLWHAAVNGRGLYFSAKDPTSLAEGVKGALGSATVKTGAAAASATSSPNITPSDNFIYSSTYRTVHWDGEVVAKTIDTQTGEVSESNVWSAQANLDTQGAGRTIYKMDTPVTGTPARETFEWANLSVAEKAFFNNKCSLLSQCVSLDADTKLIADDGEQLLSFLRGDSTHENAGTTPSADKAFRDRQHILGDTVNATPAFVKAPRFSFTDDGYSQYKIDQKNRQGMLYVAANDGMLHAFNASTGAETWAYVPHIVMKDMYQLTDKNYGAKHQYLVDGSPQVMDIKAGGSWKTILVGGLNGGGRGYYALDVTNPASPVVLWEFCYDSTYCNVSDEDLGFTYGNPVIAKMPTGSAHAGQWVVMVTSGYNNVSPGDGEGHLYVLNAATGAILQKVSTGVGSGYVDESNPGDPSGLAKISAWADNGDLDATATHVYGGDLKGNLWRFNLKTSTVSVSKMAELAAGGVAQPITTKPELGLVKGITDHIVYVGTGRYLGGSDLTNTATQSIYAIRDTGSEIDTDALIPRTISRSGTTATVAGDDMNWASGGWYADFGAKERVNIDPQLSLGTLIVATSTPEGSTCSPGGYSWIYQFNYDTGLQVGTSTLGQKKSSGLIVGIVVFRLPNGQLKAVATTGDGTQDTFGVNVGSGGGGSRRTGWRELTQ